MLATLFPISQATAEDPQAIVKDTTDEVLKAIEEGGQDRKHVFEVVEQMVLPHFDSCKMSQWVLGKNWRQGSPEQQDRFVAGFQNLLVRTYSTALSEYKGQQIRYMPTQETEDGQLASARTQVEQGGGNIIPIDYLLYDKDGAWKVFDVAVDGVSLVANYRTSFNEVIGTKGFDGLVADLAAKNAKSTMRRRSRPQTVTPRTLPSVGMTMAARGSTAGVVAILVRTGSTFLASQDAT